MSKKSSGRRRTRAKKLAESVNQQGANQETTEQAAPRIDQPPTQQPDGQQNDMQLVGDVAVMFARHKIIARGDIIEPEFGLESVAKLVADMRPRRSLGRLTRGVHWNSRRDGTENIDQSSVQISEIWLTHTGIFIYLARRGDDRALEIIELITNLLDELRRKKLAEMTPVNCGPTADEVGECMVLLAAHEARSRSLTRALDILSCGQIVRNADLSSHDVCMFYIEKWLHNVFFGNMVTTYTRDTIPIHVMKIIEQLAADHYYDETYAELGHLIARILDTSLCPTERVMPPAKPPSTQLPTRTPGRKSGQDSCRPA